jgi:hypothetical protein
MTICPGAGAAETADEKERCVGEDQSTTGLREQSPTQSTSPAISVGERPGTLHFTLKL